MFDASPNEPPTGDIKTARIPIHAFPLRSRARPLCALRELLLTTWDVHVATRLHNLLRTGSRDRLRATLAGAYWAANG